MTKRVVAALALALVVLGCGERLELGEPVPLLPGYPEPPMGKGCWAMNVTGPLVVDPEYGTALIIEAVGNVPFRTVVRWQEGYTARRAGSEVAVLDQNGQVVAVTGRKYRFEKFDYPGYPDPPGFSACGPPDPL